MSSGQGPRPEYGFESSMERARLVVDHTLQVLLDNCQAPDDLKKAMRYAVFSGGKRLRPAMVLAAAELFGSDDDAARFAAAAVEFVHTYSLIHDDLPAMDNDDMRRGKPTVHRAFDEATAILAGDGLLTLAFGVLAGDLAALIGSKKAATAVGFLASAAGPAGMVGGQFTDVRAAASKGRLSRDDTLKIHRSKTGELFAASLGIGALLGEASEDDLKCLKEFGYSFGLAFQLTDDLLDYDRELKLGCGVAVSYAVSHSKEETVALATQYSERCRALVEPYGDKALFLRDLSDFVLSRSH